MYKILANTIFLGKDAHFLPECHSTNDIALQLIKNRQAAEGTLVITENQTKGKGQRGNVWQTAAGQNLTFSLILSPKFMDISEQFYLNMMISNSIRSLLIEYLPELKVKWPNDLVIPDCGKIGGVLIENVFGAKGWEYAVVGVGINVNQIARLPDRAISMKSMTGSVFELKELLQLLVTQIEQGYLKLKKRDLEAIRLEFERHMFQFDLWKSYQTEEGRIKGKITGVSKEGYLLLETEKGEKNQFGIKELQFLW